MTFLTLFQRTPEPAEPEATKELHCWHGVCGKERCCYCNTPRYQDLPLDGHGRNWTERRPIPDEQECVARRRLKEPPQAEMRI